MKEKLVMDKNEEQNFFETIASIGKELFSEYLTDLTRKRQANLLVSSIIAILLSYTVVKPVEATITGLKINFVNTQILPLLAGMVCIYFLAIYGIGVLQDWQYYQYRQMPTFEGIRKIQNYYQTLVMNIENKLDDAVKHEKKVVVKDPENLGFQVKRDIAGEFMYLVQNEFNPDKAEQLLEYLDMSQEEFGNVYISAIIADRKIKFLTKTNKKFEQLNKLRLSLEVAFPIGLSLFAIGSTIWAGFFR
jgi:hypothetical protein